MLSLPKKDAVALEKLLKSILGKPDPLAKVLAKLLIERGIITMPELADKLWADGTTDQAPLEDKSKDRFVDIRGKVWAK